MEGEGEPLTKCGYDVTIKSLMQKISISYQILKFGKSVKMSRIVFIVFIFCNFYLSYDISVAGTNEIVSRDEAVSARLFVEGKSWFRVIDIYDIFVPRSYKSVTVSYKVVKGYSEWLQNPDEIVIEVDNPAIDKGMPNNPYRVVLSPKGTFLGYRLFRKGKWLDWKMRRGEKYEKRLQLEINTLLHFYYCFFPLPILWKESSFQLDNFGGPPSEITTKVENNTLRVYCRKFLYQMMQIDSNKWKLDKNNKVHDDEIQITFKKGEPWATSIKTRKFMNLNFRTPKN